MTTSRSLQLAAIGLALTGLTAAYAQDRKAAPFLGPAIGVSAASVQTSLSYDGNSQDIGSKSQTSVGVFASWGFGLAPDWVLSTAVAYHPESTTLASETGVNTNVFPPKTQTLALKSQNEWVFSVQPGYRIRDNQLVYAKLSYHTMDAVASSSLYADTQKESIEAPGFGLGYAIAITPNLQLQGEYESITFSRSGLTKSSQDILSIGVAYRF